MAWDKLRGLQPFDVFSDVEFAWHSRKGKATIFSWLWKGSVCQKTGGEENGRRVHPMHKRTKGTQAVREIKSKVVGVGYHNDDGTRRQDLIADCAPGDRLSLVHDPENPRDENTVEVWHERTGKQIGRFYSGLVPDIVKCLQEGGAAKSSIMGVTGGVPGNMARGVNIKITFLEWDEPHSAIDALIRWVVEHPVKLSFGGILLFAWICS